MQRQLNPGNINVRLGALMQEEEQAIKTGNLDVACNLQDMQADYLSVYMKEAEWAFFAKMPGLIYDGHLPEEERQTAAQAHNNLRTRRRYLLNIARRAGVFARAPELETGDASSLDEEEVTA